MLEPWQVSSALYGVIASRSRMTAINAPHFLKPIKFNLNKHGLKQRIMLDVCGTHAMGVTKYFLIGL